MRSSRPMDTEYWKSVGLVAVMDTSTITIGTIEEVTTDYALLIDLNGNKHWISQSSIVHIFEVGGTISK